MEIQANGITVAYDLLGGGETVTFIHGLGLDRAMCTRQFPAFSAAYFGPSYQVLAYDVRGHGRSGKPEGPYSIDLFAADLKALLDALGLRRTHLVGLSMGGMIAQAFALQYPELLGSLVLVSTAAGQTPQAYQMWQQRAAIAATEGMAPLVEPALERWFTAPYRREHPEVVDRFRQQLAGNDPAAYIASAMVVATIDLARELHRIAVPTLIVAGEEDPGTTPAVARSIHRRIPGSQLLVLPAQSHLLPVSASEEFNQAVLEFLASSSA